MFLHHTSDERTTNSEKRFDNVKNLYVLFLLLKKKLSLAFIPCTPLNGIGNLLGNINGGCGRKHGRRKTKEGGSK